MKRLLMLCVLLCGSVQAEEPTDKELSERWAKVVSERRSERFDTKQSLVDSLNNAHQAVLDLAEKAKHGRVVRPNSREAGKPFVFTSYQDQKRYVKICKDNIAILIKATSAAKLGNQRAVVSLLEQCEDPGQDSEAAEKAVSVARQSIVDPDEAIVFVGGSAPVLFRANGVDPLPKKHDMGIIIDSAVRCFQVLDKSSFLMEVRNHPSLSLPDRDKVFMVEGMDTSGMTDDADLGLAGNMQPFFVSGTFQYQSQAGPRTVLKLRAIKTK